MPQILGDRYELGRVLGTGGMGKVQEAVDGELGRRVAVKLLTGDSVDPIIRARFLREATFAARFTHPHAVTVFDAGEDDGTLYLVMELVGGPTLADVLADRSPLDPAEAVAVADQVLAAVGAGHGRGLVHRDIKPSNILFTEDGVAKLGDFGIAKGMGEMATRVTATGQVIGTPRYLSPEQVAGWDAIPASDLYAVGVVLYEMLTGTAPFEAETAFATALAHQRQPLPRLVDRRPELDRDLAAVVERALAKAPEARYPDAAAMRAALASPKAAVAAMTAMAGRGDPATTTGARARKPGDVETTLVSTQEMDAVPHRSAKGRFTEWWRRIALLASMALVAAGFGAAAVLWAGGRDDGSDPPTGEMAQPAPTTTAPSDPATQAPPSTAFIPPTSTATPSAVDSVTDLVAAAPDAFGDKADNLLDKLEKAQREARDEQSKEARKTIDEIEKWVSEGQLDPEVAHQAVSALEPLAGSPGDGGRDDEGGGDDDEGENED